MKLKLAERFLRFHKMKKVMIIEDDPLIRDMMEELITLIPNCQYISFSGGNPAIEYFNNISVDNKIDLIISDVRMGDGDGVSFLKKLRKKDRKIPIMMMTGYSDVDKELLMNMGANAIVMKPFELKSIIVEIKKFL